MVVPGLPTMPRDVVSSVPPLLSSPAAGACELARQSRIDQMLAGASSTLFPAGSRT